ncbi:MAG: DoxX family membrane protein [Deltaproteobacteria bacterium]|nr:DoxX family membrane protein [Deltaproteobacteria bacterium]
MESLIRRARRQRWAHLCVVNLRILLGFAFVPAGLKKLLDQPFTDPSNSGRFHDFLDAFHATGWFYQLVGILQLTIAVLLMTQRFATLGALLALPVLTAILALCWSTGVYPTAIVVTLMFLGTLALVAWDHAKWRSLLAADDGAPAPPPAPGDVLGEPPVSLRLWQLCGVAVIVVYVGVCLAMGEVYRPKGARPDSLGFYVFPVILALPIVTYVLDRRSRRTPRPSGATPGR